MSTLQVQVEEWKQAQHSRLPKVLLPCRHCHESTEVQFDAPEKCSRCGASFMGESWYLRRFLNLLIALLILGFGLLCIEAFRQGEFTPKDASPGLVRFLRSNGFVFFVGLAFIIPVVKFFFSALYQTASSATAPAKERERWVRYTNAITKARRIRDKAGSGVISKDNTAWLHARSLLAPYQHFSEWDLVKEEANDFWFACRHELSSNIEALLKDLLWVDEFLLDCIPGSSWDRYSEDRFKIYGSESPALVDFAIRLKSTEATRIKSQQGTLLLKWIAGCTSGNALREALLQSRSDRDQSG